MDMDPGVEIAWAGFRWLADAQKDYDMRRCAVIAFGAEYGKLHWIKEAARISAFLAPADRRRDPQDPWVGFSKSAVLVTKGKRDSEGNRIPIWRKSAKCSQCGDQVEFNTSTRVLHLHRQFCKLV